MQGGLLQAHGLPRLLRTATTTLPAGCLQLYVALPLAIYLANLGWNMVRRRGALARVVKAEVSGVGGWVCGWGAAAWVREGMEGRQPALAWRRAFTFLGH